MHRRILVLLAAAGLASPGAQGQSLPLTVIAASNVASGPVAPPGLPGLMWTDFTTPQLDGTGRIAFSGALSGPGVQSQVNDSCVVVAPPGASPWILFRVGDGAGSGGGGAGWSTGLSGIAWGALYLPIVAHSGKIALYATLAASGSATYNSEGFWIGDLGSSASPTLLFHSGVTSGVGTPPGLPGASFRTFFPYPRVFGESGLVTQGQLNSNVGPVGATDTYGVWGLDGLGGMSLYSRSNTLAAGAPEWLPGAKYSSGGTQYEYALSNSGRFAYVAFLSTTAGGVTSANNSAVLEHVPGGAMTLVARKGDPVPGQSGMSFFSFDVYNVFPYAGGVSVNSAGDIVFADLTTTLPPSSSCSRIYRRRPAGAGGTGGSVELVASYFGGSGGPGSPPLSGTYFTMLRAPLVNSAGRLLFNGSWSGSTGGSAMWLEDSSGHLVRIADTSASGPTAPPGIPGARFSSFLAGSAGSFLDYYAINASSQVLFRGFLSTLYGGVTASTAEGLWAYDPSLGLMQVVRLGQAVTIQSGDTRTVSAIWQQQPTGDDDGHPIPLNNAGKIAFKVDFADGTHAILSAQIPGASGACCSGSICTVVAQNACSGAATRFVGAGLACNAPGNATTPCCKADFDQTGSTSVLGIFSFLNAWFVPDIRSDFNGDAAVEVGDIFDFLNAWFAGC